MIAQYVFDIDSAQLVSVFRREMGGAVESHVEMGTKTRECVAVTVKEGDDAVQEFYDSGFPVWRIAPDRLLVQC